MSTDLALKKYDTDLAQQQNNIGMRSVLTPVNVNEAMELAKMFHASGMYAVQSVPQAFVILAMGMELGLSATQAFRMIHVVKNKPCPSADCMVALVKSKSVCQYFKLIETTADKATYETLRVGEDPIQMSFTLKQAEKAGLLAQNDNYRKYPEAMLRARAAAALARAVYPDVCAGMYTPEEIDAIDVTQRTAQPPLKTLDVNQYTDPPASEAPSPADKAERIALKKSIIAIIDKQPQDEQPEIHAGVLKEYGLEVKNLSLEQARDCETRLKKAFTKPDDFHEVVTAKAGLPSDRASGEGYVSDNAKPADDDDPFADN